VEPCDECGFDFETAQRSEVPRRVTAAAQAIATLLRQEPVHSTRRPEPDRWSMLEYGAHVRDVFLTIRDRLVIGLVEHDPTFKPLYRDERITLALYRADRPSAVAAELDASAAMLVRLFQAIDPESLSRPVQYGFPDPTTRTLLWMGLQAIHEAEHHCKDVRDNLQRLATTQ